MLVQALTNILLWTPNSFIPLVSSMYNHMLQVFNSLIVSTKTLSIVDFRQAKSSLEQAPLMKKEKLNHKIDTRKHSQ